MAKIELGDGVRDRITGFVGIAVARTEWLHGVPTVMVQGGDLKDGIPTAAQSFDEPRLEVTRNQAYPVS